MEPNLAVSYLYRDAGNFKAYHTVVFPNPTLLTPEEVAARLRNACLSREYFLAHQVRLPELFLAIDDRITRHDHCFHEIDSVEAATGPPDDIHSRSVSQFLIEFEAANRAEWQAFPIFERA